MTFPPFSIELVTRGLMALAIITCGLTFYWLANRWILFQAEKNGARFVHDIPGVRHGVPIILYFTTPECVPCKTVQRPALQKLMELLGDQRLQVIEVNTKDHPDLASRWGVLSVPTTFILNKDRKLLHVNHGATRVEKLLEQVQPPPL